ncbi:CheY chemotaxis protein or a CheY-like REC (receiver) domain [Catalinimonas alkaloidigena]|uniref:CheY chemotaxis protein or a CheY-like REC (Receiver) domain n=1 Tax=Catalinimonas alkaloidigena TaxID=1075417 RepID=A0A1G9RKI3_9BACT|nr:response regulator [Catalinimonas alkaloidigena]SDM23671.1 CheY chemotaxis protein or a CheY-like REC (receiver) domain [Catalinimonas alkaloidigena]
MKISVTESYRTLKILLLEDSEDDAELIQRELEKAGYILNLVLVEDEKEFRFALQDFQPDLILSDYLLPAFSGFYALRIAQAEAPEIPFIFVSGAVGEEIAAETILDGASGFVLKSNLRKLPLLINQVFSKEGNWLHKRIKKTSERAHDRIRANLDALDRLERFLDKVPPEQDTGDRNEAEQDLRSLKKYLSDDDQPNDPTGQS